MKRSWPIWGILTITLILAAYSCGGSGSSGDDNDNDDSEEVVSHGDTTEVKTQTVDSSGGTIEITDSSSPLYGLKIEMPAGAVDEDVSFTVSYSDVSSVSGIPSTATAASKLISIGVEGTSSQWSEYQIFDQWAVVTLPYESGGTNQNPTFFYAVNENTGKLESTGVFAHDSTNKTMSFLIGHPGNYVAITMDTSAEASTSQKALWSWTSDTSFRPSADGWSFENQGSYYEQGGICMGMTTVAKWYYDYVKVKNGGAKLIDHYTNRVAIEYVTRASMSGMLKFMGGYNDNISSDMLLTQQFNNPSSNLIGSSIINALYNTGQPQIIGIYTQFGERLSGHQLLAYRYDQDAGRLYVYDPNLPENDEKYIELTYDSWNGAAFPSVYESSEMTGGALLQYNIFLHMGIAANGGHEAFNALYEAANGGFSTSIFPTIEITACKAWDAATGTAGDDCEETTDLYQILFGAGTVYVTDATAVRLYGTVLGGYAQGGPSTDDLSERMDRIVNKLYLSTDTQSTRYEADIDNSLDSGTGKIQSAVGGATADGISFPLNQGDNNFTMLATNIFNNINDPEAAYLYGTVRSTATRSDMIITLTWDADNSDVDLHILEPTVGSTSGRHIYWYNTGQSGDPSTKPYLDFDNRTGYGPEHYYATDGMSTYDENGNENSNGLYGTYKFRVHYFSGSGTVTWTVNYRYLDYADESADVEYWVDRTVTGTITGSSYGVSQSGIFDASDSSLSDVYTITYSIPDSSTYSGGPSIDQMSD